LSEEIYDFLKPRTQSELFIDATLGEGGHSEFFLRRSPDIMVAGIDADSHILSIARDRLADYGDRVRYFNTWFNLFFAHYPLGEERPDSILFDLGISNFHYKKAGRGFSFTADEPLDMRLDKDLEISAADIVNDYPEVELANLIFEYGEERYSRKIAAAITRYREEKYIGTAKELETIIWNAVPAQYKHGHIHPATRTFQALRIVVNGELARLKVVLHDALKILKVGGRMAVISFHSLEDRIVKEFFREKNKACTCPSDWPICTCGGVRVVDILTKKPVIPGEEEIEKNPPSRSAKLRVAEKTSEKAV
jgi:16S rRNA (cytosine1402-N4)-methyltransferase